MKAKHLRGLKLCYNCKQTKPLKDFKTCEKQGKTYYTWCVECYRNYARKHYKNNNGIIKDREIDFGGNWLKTLNRDRLKCRICFKNLKEHRPNVHHIDEIGRHKVKDKIKLNNELDNLVSLCVGCHSRIHKAVKWVRKELERRLFV